MSPLAEHVSRVSFIVCTQQRGKQYGKDGVDPAAWSDLGG